MIVNDTGEKLLKSMLRRINLLERRVSRDTVPLSTTTQTLSTQDLNTVLSSGIYVQPANVDATASRHYPFNQAGWLQVTDARGVGDGLIFQTYQEYGFSGAAQVRRAWRGWVSSRGWSQWRITGGQTDTGWVTVPLRTGYSHHPGFTMQVRKERTKVTMRGGIGGSASINAGGTYNIADLPTLSTGTFAPSQSQYQMGGGSTPMRSPLFSITQGGVIDIRINEFTSGYYLTDGINWYTD